MRFSLETNRSNMQLFEKDGKLLAFILSLAKHLTDLTLAQRLTIFPPDPTFDLLRTRCVSSTLTKLDIDLYCLQECLYLLHGRLDCLSTIIVRIKRICLTPSVLRNGVKIHSITIFD
jgi:hypothetical protein